MSRPSPPPQTNPELFAEKLWLYLVSPLAIGAITALVGRALPEVYSSPGGFWWQTLLTMLVTSLTFIAIDQLLSDQPPPREEAELVSLPLQTERLPRGTRRLLRDLSVQVRDREVVVPAGTETDFSSIPSFGRFVVRWSQVDIAGVIHDWLYRTGEVSRREADAIWYICARSGETRANTLQAWVAWASLRIGGGPAWSGARRADGASSG